MSQGIYVVWLHLHVWLNDIEQQAYSNFCCMWPDVLMWQMPNSCLVEAQTLRWPPEVAPLSSEGRNVPSLQSVCTASEHETAAMPVQRQRDVLQSIWESSRRILGEPGTHRGDLRVHHDHKRNEQEARRCTCLRQDSQIKNTNTAQIIATILRRKSNIFSLLWKDCYYSI